MKREKLRFFAAYFAAFVLTAAVVSCDRFGNNPKQVLYTDTTYVADAPINTDFSFTTVEEVCNFHATVVEEFLIDEVFRTMPKNVLTNVATVCLKKLNTVTKKDIVEEYRANSSVYDNLQQPTDNNKEPIDDVSTVVEGQPTLAPVPVSTSYYYIIDTVNGKPVKMLVKEEKYESK